MCGAMPPSMAFGRSLFTLDADVQMLTLTVEFEPFADNVARMPRGVVDREPLKVTRTHDIGLVRRTDDIE